MSFGEFINKYNGRAIDFDGSFGAQCMDLYRQYVKEVLSLPQSPPVVGAKDVWDTYITDKYDRIPNTPSGVPQKGDIVIWGKEVGEFGHIAIFIEGGIGSFNSFDQNWPAGTKCHIQSHTYAGVLGWIRPKTVIITPPQDLTQDQKTALALLETLRIKQNFGSLESTVRGAEGAFSELPNFQKEIINLKDEIEATKVVLEIERKRIFSLEQENSALRKQVEAGLGKPLFKFGNFVLYQLV